MFEIDFLLQATKGKALSQPHATFSGYSVNSQDPQIADRLFIPLVGENHDAHQFVTSAVEAGATGVLIHQWQEEWEPLKTKASFVLVDDTLKGLQNFAQSWRRKFQGKVLALTGSNGKTTTKDFLSQILGGLSGVEASRGSFNNHWGVPFTLLETNPQTPYCVVEMGMNHSGEISSLVQIANPDLVMVTNVGRAHMGNFKNGIQGVAQAKEEIYQFAKSDAQLIFNIDNEHTRAMYQKYCDRPSYTFSIKNFSADVYFRIKNRTSQGLEVEGQIGGVLGKASLKFWGDHNVENLAAAVCMAYIAGCRPGDIWPLLQDCHCGWGRNQWLQSQSEAKILFDGYNANPDSFQQLLKNVTPLVESEPNCIAVFGEMLELGENSAELHYQLGELAGRLAWQQCYFIGPSGDEFAKGWKASGNSKKPVILNTYEESLAFDIPSMVDQSSFIIVKGSRGLKLERVVERLSPTHFQPK